MRAHSHKATQISLILMLFGISYNLNADVYRWKDSKGIMQYSDRPPASIASKSSQDLLLKIVKNNNYCINPVVNKAASTSTEPLNGYGFFSKIKAKITQKQNSNNQQSTPSSRAHVAGKSLFNPLSYNTVTPKTPYGVTIATNGTFNKIPVSNVKSETKPPSNITLTSKPNNTNSEAPTTVATNTNNNPQTNTLNSGLMPIVDQTKTPFGDFGYGTLRLKAASHDGLHNDGLGAFRTECAITHYSNDDPIIYPGIKGAAHHHTFFGNSSANFASTPESIRTSGNSSCAGGTANRTGYWIPSIIDTNTGAPLKPFRGIIYYKAGVAEPTAIQNFPRNLRMIAGNPKATTESDSTANFACVNESATNYQTGLGKVIPACSKSSTGQAINGYIRLRVEFPNCWDGKNLDSPDHKSHMAYANGGHQDASGKWYYPPSGCPTTHPIPVPQVTEIFDFEVTDALNGTNKWRLASDNYSTSQRGGLSLHADWMNGWDESIMGRIVKNCLNKSIDCGVNYLGDGQGLY